MFNFKIFNKAGFVIHPYIFAIYPILYIYSLNMGELNFVDIIRPTLISLACAVFLMLIMRTCRISAPKSAAIISLFLILFFLYGDAYNYFKDFLYVKCIKPTAPWKSSFGTYINENLKIIITWLWALIFFLISIFFIIKKAILADFTKIINFLAIIMFLICLGTIGINKYNDYGSNLKKQEKNKPKATKTTSAITTKQVAGVLPDIFLIVLDSYTRNDILKSMYDYDNTEFIEYLRGKGFYVDDRASVNYMQTVLSLTSMLELNYLDEFVKTIGENSNNRWVIYAKLKQNAVFQFLQQYGYKIAAFSSGYMFSEIDTADLYLKPDHNFTEFEYVLIDKTFLSRLLEIKGLSSRLSPYELHRKRIKYILENVPEIPSKVGDGPSFIFAPVNCPHHPFVFQENGELPEHPPGAFKTLDGFTAGVPHLIKIYRKLYRAQLIFLNTQVKKMIDEIFLKAKRPFIIILQGDHGPSSMLDWNSKEKTDLRERLSILNAYYFPDKDYSMLGNAGTPVNTFRIVFNKYFGAQHKILNNKNYFSTFLQPYKFYDVTANLADNASRGRPGNN